MKRNIIRRIRRKIRRFRGKKTEELKVPSGKKPYIGKVPILRVSEACELLDIKIPRSYFKYRNYYITDTPFVMKKMANDKDFNLNITIKKKTSEQYHKQLSQRAEESKKFKGRYTQAVNLKQTDEEMLSHFIHWYCVFLPMKYTYTVRDYFAYELYRKTIGEAKKFTSTGYLRYLARVLAIPEYRKYLSNKNLFNKTFARYVNRDFLYVGTAKFEEFDQFVNENPRFFVKPVGGQKGQGTEIIESADNSRELFEKLKDGKFIIESIVKQHLEIAEFNPDTLNTIRLTTLLPIDDNPIVTFAGIRFGRKGNFVDNMNAGGIVATIDVETGEIVTAGIDQDNNIFSNHPDSGKKFKGFKIPNWEKVLVAVKESAVALPQMRRIGWDVSVTSEGEVELIEGNSMSSVRIAQRLDQVGKKHLYEKHVQTLVDSDWKNMPRVQESVKSLK